MLSKVRWRRRKVMGCGGERGGGCMMRGFKGMIKNGRDDGRE
jgi:hypothetical protein